jgi:signal transduction histidine kinase
MEQAQRSAYTHPPSRITCTGHDADVRSDSKHLGAATSRWLVRRIRSVILLGGLYIVMLFSMALPDAPADFRTTLVTGVLAIFLFCAWAAYRLLALYVRAEREREATTAEAARLEGVTLAARTVRHHLANRLAVTVGFSEMLADDPRLPDELGEQARKIMTSATAAVETVDRLQGPITRVQLDSSVAGPALLDLDASTAVEPAPTRPA